MKERQPLPKDILLKRLAWNHEKLGYLYARRSVLLAELRSVDGQIVGVKLESNMLNRELKP